MGPWLRLFHKCPVPTIYCNGSEAGVLVEA